MYSFNRRVLFLFLTTIFIAASCHAEYLVYRLDAEKTAAIFDEKEHAQIHDILMTYQFPMNTNRRVDLEKRLSKEEISLLDRDEQAFLEAKLQGIDKNIRLLWIPLSLYEHFVINYFIGAQDNGIKRLFSELQAFTYDPTEDARLVPIFNRFKEIQQSTMSEASKKCALDASMQRLRETWCERTGKSFMFYGFPLQYDPMYADTIDGYAAASDNLNRLNLFVQTHYCINKGLFEFLKHGGYCVTQVEKSLPLACSLALQKVLVDACAKMLKNSDDKDLSIAYVQAIDKALMPHFSKIFEVEYEAKKMNSVVVYRGTNGIADRLDSPVKIGDDKRVEPLALSYGSGVYAAALVDKGSCAATYVAQSTNFYAMLIDKRIYRLNTVKDPDANVMYLHPYSSTVSFWGRGKTCHPRAKSCLNSTVGRELYDKLVHPPMFFALFGTKKTFEVCDSDFAAYCVKNVRVIKMAPAKSWQICGVPLNWVTIPLVVAAVGVAVWGGKQVMFQ